MGKSTSSALQISAFLISTIYLDFCAAGNPVFQDQGYYEGNRCGLENGEGDGVCMKLTDCSSRMQEIRDGRYSGADRCGFTNFEEIVCCAERSRFERNSGDDDNRTGLIKRAAVVACEKYKEMIKEIEENFPLHSIVYDGVEARPGEFPHTVALGYPASKEEQEKREAIEGIKYICAGTLISQKHVLTAAHCVSNIRELVPVEVMLGATDIADFNPKLTQRIPISRIVKHPRYNQSFDYHDIAVLELENSAKFSTYVHPTCLITKSLENQNARTRRSFTALGWGAVDLKGTRSTKLLKADGLNFVEKKSCSKMYKNIRARIPNGLDDGMICVDDPSKTRWFDNCWGNGGGPLLASIGTFPSIAGIASFQEACGKGVPGVYVSVYNYLEWIEEQVWPQSRN